MSALYTGTVRHRRFTPKVHGFTYPVFMALLDLDRLQESMGVSHLLGFNRFAWAGYDDRDHLGDPSLPLKDRFRADAEAKGFVFPEGRAMLLANLRFWGYCFNPVSYLYAYDAEDRLALIGAEVCNTPWKERMVYWMKVEADDARHSRLPSFPVGVLAEPGSGDSTALPAEASSGRRSVQKGWSFDVAKAMHVSPFMPMDLRYRWSFTPPGAAHTVRMALFRGSERVFDADLKLERRDWTPSAIRRTLFAYPFHTLKVITAIHWEAMKLWFKRVPIFTHPAKM